MKKVLIAYRLKPEGLTALDGRYEVIMPKDKSYFNEQEIMDRVHDVEVLVPNLSFYTGKEMIGKAKKLELISNFAVGFNNIDIAYATERGVVVANIPNSTREPTAEFAFALLLGAARRVGYYDRNIRTPKGVSWGIYADSGVAVYGKTLGIIGMGRIGQSLARRAVASGMEIIYHNRNRLDESIEKLYGARYVSREELLRGADFISLNAPSTPETYHLIGEDEFAMMKPTAVFVNTARGNMVDEEALVKALREEQIFAAALDVFENEPNVSPELLELDNVLLAPHAATRTIEDRIEMSVEMSRNIAGFYENSYPISRVN